MVIKFKENSSFSDVYSVSAPTKYENELLDIYLMDNDKLYQEHHALVCNEDPAHICSVEYKGKPSHMTEARHTRQYESKYSRNIGLFDIIKNGKQVKWFDKLFYVISLKTPESSQIIGHFEVYWDGDQIVQFAVYVNKKFCSRGYGTLATKSVLELVKEHMQVKKVIYECNDNNIGSYSIPEHLGFIKNKSSYPDACSYSLDLN